MSEYNEGSDKKSYKTVTSNSVTGYTDRIEYSVSYDDGTTDKYVESKWLKSASRYSRLADFVMNAKLGDKKEINSNDNSTESE